MKKYRWLSLIVGACFFVAFSTGCKDKKKELAASGQTAQTTSEKTPQVTSEEELVKDIAQDIEYILRAFYESDLKHMDKVSRKFNLELVDLNGDGLQEHFIALHGDYFCGSGGCTFLILDDDFTLTTRFTVTRAPFVVLDESSQNTGWKDLAVRRQDGWKRLVFDGKSYPTNPSMVEETLEKEPDSALDRVFDKELAERQFFRF